jgi:hypothetical protein
VGVGTAVAVTAGKIDVRFAHGVVKMNARCDVTVSKVSERPSGLGA